MKALHLFEIDHVDQIVSPENFVQTTLESPASEVFTDFKQHKALVVLANTPAPRALEMMMQEHVKMKVVLSTDGEFVGVISTNELTERKIVSEVAKGSLRDDVLVSDLMISRDSLKAFDFDELKKARVRDVIQSLKGNGLQHCLVVDHHLEQIRGVISSSDIARKLHLPIQIDNLVSFKKIFEAVRGYKHAS